MKKFGVVLALLFTVSIFAQTEKGMRTEIDFNKVVMIHVDRAKKPMYPSFISRPVSKDLEQSGPSDYDLAKIRLFLHDAQKYEPMSGDDLYKYMQSSNNLSRCLNLQDGEVITAMGAAVFRSLFGNDKLYLWKSVSLCTRGQLAVPYLFERDGRVKMDWSSLGSGWGDDSPALIFP